MIDYDIGTTDSYSREAKTSTMHFMHIAVRQILLSCWDIKNGRSVPKLFFPFFSLFFFNTSLQALGGQRNLTELRTSLPLVLFLFYFFLVCAC